jgi:hypothetical protein
MTDNGARKQVFGVCDQDFAAHCVYRHHRYPDSAIVDEF